MAESKEEIILTDEQKLKIITAWNERPKNPPSVPELIEIVWGDKFGDARSVKGRTVKKFLQSRKIEVPKVGYKPKGLIDLTQKQKDEIANLFSCSVSTLEITRYVFENETLTPLSQEFRTINEEVKTLSPKTRNNPAVNTKKEESSTLADFDGDELTKIPDTHKKTSVFYIAPKSEERCIVRINKYVNAGIDREHLTPQQLKCVRSLINYLNTFRFLSQINTYTTI